MSNKLIFATIGPSSINKEIIHKMDKSGVDVFRINLSHTGVDEFVSMYDKVSKWTTKPVYPDTEGAQLRTGQLFQQDLVVETNDIIELVGIDSKSSKNIIPLNLSSLKNIFVLGDLLKIDFEEVMIQIIDINEKSIIAKVITGGLIRSNKGISVDRHIDLPFLTKKDLEVIKICNRLNINTIFLSFCSHGESIVKLRKLFDYGVKIISKVELPIAGLLSDKRANIVAKETREFKKYWNNYKCSIPYMGFNLLPLSVIPEFRLTNKGLVDVNKMKIVPLFE